MGEQSEPHDSGLWRIAVWSLRLGYVALAVAFAGLILVWVGSTPWILTVGEILWLAAAGVTVVAYLWSRLELPEPRPGYRSMLTKLISDTVHARSSAVGT